MIPRLPAHAWFGRPRRSFVSRQRIGLILVAIISVALGIVIGQLFRILFMNTVPQAMITPVLRATIVSACLAYGVGIGIAIFLWVLGGAAVLKVFAAKKSDGAELAAKRR